MPRLFRRFGRTVQGGEPGEQHPLRGRPALLSLPFPSVMSVSCRKNQDFSCTTMNRCARILDRPSVETGRRRRPVRVCRRRAIIRRLATRTPPTPLGPGRPPSCDQGLPVCRRATRVAALLRSGEICQDSVWIPGTEEAPQRRLFSFGDQGSRFTASE